MPDPQSPSLHDLGEDAALRMILEGTASKTGEGFFRALVENLAKAMNTHSAWVTEYFPEVRRLRALAFYANGEWIENYEFDVGGTPCETVIDSTDLIHFPDKLLELYPRDHDLKNPGAVSYMGLPLFDLGGAVLGHVAIMDVRTMPEDPRAQAIFRIFAGRAAAELRRLRAEREIRDREEKLVRLVDSAMDAIVELNADLDVTVMNTAAEKIFGCRSRELIGSGFGRFITEESRQTLTRLVKELDGLPEGCRYLWIPGGLDAQTSDGEAFAAEATLSRYEMERHPYYTLVLRNVNDRLQAERKIESLEGQTRYLREEIRALHDFDEIIGCSGPLLQVLHDVEQVAETDATVVIQGESGTGKELIARAIHNKSPRRAKPLISVNCAAIPDALIESELFGHEKGAFTGATEKREGRFALADGGTIFLDEVGELPVQLQAKLLRVLQEGELEPVGSSRTRRVDVRVVAATNRDLEKAAKSGDFREDLYYRLNVFPIRVPPLRERADDVPLLAATFAERYAKRIGRTIQPLSAGCMRQLQSYSWPGNVRELQNVIERAVIIARDGRLNLDRALEGAGGAPPVNASPEPSPDRIRTVAELQDLERRNLVRALEATDWKVSGDAGAARLLGMNPSTLSSRMRALGIKRKA